MNALDKFMQFGNNLIKSFSPINVQQPIKQGPMSVPVERPIQDVRMEILRRNLLAQTPYTQRARENIMNMNLNVADTGNAAALGGGMNVTMKPDYLSQKTAPVDILRHEVLHNMDANTYNSSIAGDPNSIGFANKLPNDVRNRILNYMRGANSLYDTRNRQTRDVETYAYAGENPNKAISSGLYKDVYAPMSVPLPNYSPTYQTTETRNRINNLFNTNKSSNLIPTSVSSESFW